MNTKAFDVEGRFPGSESMRRIDPERTISRKEETALRRAFEAFDINGSWTIEQFELNELFKLLGLGHVSPQELARKFKQLDVDGSGDIDFMEFVAMYIDIKKSHMCTPETAAEILGKRPYERSIDELRRLGNYLAHDVPWFSRFTPAMQHELCRVATVAHYESGEWAWHQGQRNDSLLCVLRGTVSLWARPVGAAPLTPSALQASIRASSRATSHAASRAMSRAVSRNVSRRGTAAQWDGEGLDAASRRTSMSGGVGNTSFSTGTSLSRSNTMSFHQRLIQALGDVDTGLDSDADTVSDKPTSPLAVVMDGNAVTTGFGEALNSAGQVMCLGAGAGAQGSASGGGGGASPEPASIRPYVSRSKTNSAEPTVISKFKAVVSMVTATHHTQRLLMALKPAKAMEGGSSSSEDKDQGAGKGRSLSTGEVDLGRTGSGSLDAALKDDGGVRANSAGELDVTASSSTRTTYSGVTGRSIDARNRRLWGKVSMAVRFSARASAMSQSAGQLSTPGTPSRSSRQRVIKADAATTRVVVGSGEVAAFAPLEEVAQEDADLVAELYDQASAMRAEAVAAGTTPMVFVGFGLPGTCVGAQAMLPALGNPGPEPVHAASVMASSLVTALVLDGPALKAAVAALHQARDEAGGRGSGGGAGKGGGGSVYTVFRPDYLLDVAGIKSDARPAPDQAALVFYLSTLPSFNRLSYPLRTRLALSLRPDIFTQGELLIRQGDMPHAMYVVVSGRVGVFQHDARASVAGLNGPPHSPTAQQSTPSHSMWHSSIDQRPTPERQAALSAVTHGAAAALRAKHNRLQARSEVMTGPGLVHGPSAIITGQHIESAGKVAALIEGVTTSLDLDDLDAKAPGDETVVAMRVLKVAEALEGLLGALQQQLGPGKSVGEAELLNMAADGEQGQRGSQTPSHFMRRRATSAAALLDCSVLCVNVQAYRETLMEARRQEMVARVEALRTCSAWKGLRQAVLLTLDAALIAVDVQRGAVLHHVGDPLKGVFVVKEGTVGLFLPPARTATLHDMQAAAAAEERKAAEVEEAGGPTTTAAKPQHHTRRRSMVDDGSKGGPRPSTGFPASGAAASRRSSSGASISGRAGRKGGVLPWTPVQQGVAYQVTAPQRQVAVLGPGDYFGDDALLSPACVHTTSAMAETACKLAWLRPSDMAVLGQAGVAHLIRQAALRAQWRSVRVQRGPDEFLGTAAAAAGPGDMDAVLSGRGKGASMNITLDAAGEPGQRGVKGRHAWCAEAGRAALARGGPAAMAAAVLGPRPKTARREGEGAREGEGVTPRRQKNAYMQPRQMAARARVLASAKAAGEYTQINTSVYARWMQAAEKQAKQALIRNALDARAAGQDLEDIVDLLSDTPFRNAASLLGGEAAVPAHGTGTTPRPSPRLTSTAHISSRPSTAPPGHRPAPAHPAVLLSPQQGFTVASAVGAQAPPLLPTRPASLHPRPGQASSGGGWGEAAERDSQQRQGQGPDNHILAHRAALVHGIRRPRLEVDDWGLPRLPRPEALLAVLQPPASLHVVGACGVEGVGGQQPPLQPAHCQGYGQGLEGGQDRELGPGLVLGDTLRSGAVKLAHVPPLALPRMQLSPQSQASPRQPRSPASSAGMLHVSFLDSRDATPTLDAPSVAASAPPPGHQDVESNTEPAQSDVIASVSATTFNEGDAAPPPESTSEGSDFNCVSSVGGERGAAAEDEEGAGQPFHFEASGSPTLAHNGDAHVRQYVRPPTQPPTVNEASTPGEGQGGDLGEHAGVGQQKEEGMHIASTAHDDLGDGSAHGSGGGGSSGPGSRLSKVAGVVVGGEADPEAQPGAALAEPDTGVGADTSTGTESGVSAGTDTGTEPDTGAGAGTGAEPDTEPGTGTVTDTCAESETGAEPYTGAEREMVAVAGAEPGTGTHGQGPGTEESEPGACSSSGSGVEVTEVDRSITAQAETCEGATIFEAAALVEGGAPAVAGTQAEVQAVEGDESREITEAELPKEEDGSTHGSSDSSSSIFMQASAPDHGDSDERALLNSSPRVSGQGEAEASGGCVVATHYPDAPDSPYSSHSPAAPELSMAGFVQMVADAPPDYDLSPEQWEVGPPTGHQGGLQLLPSPSPGMTAEPRLVWRAHGHPALVPARTSHSRSGAGDRIRVATEGGAGSVRAGGRFSSVPESSPHHTPDPHPVPPLTQLLNQPPHMLGGATSTAITASHHLLLPGIKAALSGSINPADDPFTRAALTPRAQMEMRMLRGARPMSAMRPLAAHTAGRNPGSTPSPPPPRTPASPPIIYVGTRPAITTDTAWSPLLYQRYAANGGGTGGAPRPGTLNTSLTYGTSDLTSYRWRPHEPQPSQAKFTTRSQLMAMAIEKDAAMLVAQHQQLHQA